jgi:hypothetical protein
MFLNFAGRRFRRSPFPLGGQNQCLVIDLGDWFGRPLSKSGLSN